MIPANELARVADALPGLVWAASADGKLNFLNRRWREYAGRNLPEPTEAWQLMAHPDDLPGLLEDWEDIVACGLPGEIAVRLRRGDGQYRRFRMTCDPARDENGTITSWYGLCNQLDDAVHDQQSTRHAQARPTPAAGEAPPDLKTLLTAAIAHEVNQPLTGIIANCSACQHLLAADPPDVAGALETVRRSVRDGHRASEVIKRLRTLFARQDTAIGAVDINEAAREVIALSMSEFHRNGIAVRTDFSASLPLVTGDRIQLQQVIFNLLMNGTAALGTVEDRPRELEIRTEPAADGGLRVCVQDNGVGIRDIDVERLFEAFIATKSHGPGLGLPVSRTIVESHRGRLWARANDGEGATFGFSLPRAAEAT